MEELITQLLSSVRGIWQYRWLAVAVMWLVGIAGWTRVATMADDYQSSARVFVDTQSILKPLLSGMATLPNVEQQVGIMSRTLLSRPNVDRVVRMVDLDVRAITPREHEQQVDQLMAKLRISGTATYDICTITYNNKNPQLVRDVVQSLLTIFVEGSFKGKKGDSQKVVRFIDEQIKSVEEKLVATENAVKEFKMRNSALLPRQGVDYGAQLALAADALNTARLELADAAQARRAIKAQISGDEPVSIEVRAATLPNPELDARISSINNNSRYPDRIVIFDSPPLLSTTEAGVLAAQMGQVVLVIESETTTQRAVKEALRRLDNCAHINLICNKTRAFPGDDYYGYYD